MSTTDGYEEMERMRTGTIANVSPEPDADEAEEYPTVCLCGAPINEPSDWLGHEQEGCPCISSGPPSWVVKAVKV